MIRVVIFPFVGSGSYGGRRNEGEGTSEYKFYNSLISVLFFICYICIKHPIVTDLYCEIITFLPMYL